MTAPPLDLFTPAPPPAPPRMTERRKAEAGHASIVERLGQGTMAEINRAFDECLTLDSFTAENVFRALSSEVRQILELRSADGKKVNRNVLGAVFRQRSQARLIEPTGELMPAVHAGSRGRLLVVWRRSDPQGGGTG